MVIVRYTKQERERGGGAGEGSRDTDRYFNKNPLPLTFHDKSALKIDSPTTTTFNTACRCIVLKLTIAPITSNKIMSQQPETPKTPLAEPKLCRLGCGFFVSERFEKN